jgi:CRP-like cAMP-binding protein
MSAKTIHKNPGDYLFREGDTPTSLFIIQKGAVSIRVAKDRAFIELAKVSAGEVVGELAFFDRKPRSASAVAIIDTEVLEVSFESMEKIYASIPSYMKTIMNSIVARLRHADEVIKKLQKATKKDTSEQKGSGPMSAQDVLEATDDIGMNLFGGEGSSESGNKS